MKDVVLAYALKNSIDYGGKANQNAILGMVLGAHPELRTKVPEVRKEIEKALKAISTLSVKQQKTKLEKLAPELLAEKPKEEKKGLSLPDAKPGNVVMRFAPAPSGPLHLGHAYVLGLNTELCKHYQGKLYLRIEDTNSENIEKDAYDMIPEDVEWITKSAIAETIIQSDRLGTYYDYAAKLIELGGAYVCTCDPDEWKKLVNAKKACPCRDLPKKEQHHRWDKMFGEYKEGEAVLRVKTEIDHPNPAMRDWPAIRIKDHPHPRTGSEHRVWPLLNFAVAIDDHEMGITHTLRGKDHMDNEKRQRYLLDYFGWSAPVPVFVGIINFTDIELSKTKIKQAIQRGEYHGWDDVRLPFLRSLRRRGYQPEAFVRYALDVGITQNDKSVTKKEFFKTLNHFNKEVIDEKSNRYFFIQDPTAVTIENAPAHEVEIELYPEQPKRGMRTFNATDSYFLAKNDVDMLAEGKVHRLMDNLNFTRKGKKFIFQSLDYEDYKTKDTGAIIHWLPAEEKTVDVEVLMDDGTVAKGIGEAGLPSVKVGDIVQLERFGFCRLDSRTKSKMVFAYAHR